MWVFMFLVHPHGARAEADVRQIKKCGSRIKHKLPPIRTERFSCRKRSASFPHEAQCPVPAKGAGHRSPIVLLQARFGPRVFPYASRASNGFRS